MNDRTQSLEKRLDDIGWGIFLIMVGILWAAPGNWVPQGTWLIGTGALLLALNLARRWNGIALNPFTTVLGILALFAGFGDFLGVAFPLFAVCLILIGASIIIRPLMMRQRA